MNEMQEKLVDIAAWFHELCEQHNLRYYIIGGTLLGAVRHGGFIPWDDDIDVGMPRKDYDRLKEMFNMKKQGKYVIEFPDGSNKEYPYLYAKAFDTTTTFIEKTRYPVKRGLFLDIFPLDGIGNTKEEAIENFQPLKRAFILDAMISCAFLKRRAWHKNLAVFAGRIISPLFVRKQKLVAKIDGLCRRYDFDDSKLVGNLLGGSYEKGLLPSECYGTPSLIKFESVELYGVQDPDLYLSKVYGDYMKLPPEEKRISLHDSILIDLNKGYMEA